MTQRETKNYLCGHRPPKKLLTTVEMFDENRKFTTKSHVYKRKKRQDARAMQRLLAVARIRRFPAPMLRTGMMMHSQSKRSSPSIGSIY